MRKGGSELHGVLPQVLLAALLLILDGSALVAVGASMLVELGAAGNLAKAVFCSLLVADTLALNVIAVLLWRRRR